VGIRVLVVDDNEVVRSGLRSVLEREPDIEVPGECGVGRAAEDVMRRLRPDVALVNAAMLERLGGQRAALVVLMEHLAGDRAVDAVLAGAVSYLPVSADAGRVVEVVRCAARGGSVLDPQVATLLIQRVRGKDPLRVLTPREREVLVTLSMGRSNREIARALSLTEETVRSYVSHILAKLGLQDRTQAAIFGLQRGLVALDEALA
jgi:NarL family two-component system response regulator LiaR